MATGAHLLELERTIVDAWPADESVELGGWLLRSSGGPTRRGNSVSPLADSGEPFLPERISAVERWYAQRGAKAIFQIGPCVAPAGLDSVLQARGYEPQGDSRVATAAPASILAAARAESAALTRIPSEAWLQVAARESRFAESEEVLVGFLRRLGERCSFATVHDERGHPISAGLGIRSGTRLGVYAMFTTPAARRKGAARSALGAFAEQAEREGLTELYLLVDAGNLAARSLYASCGFADVYAYHYRVQPSR